MLPLGSKRQRGEKLPASLSEETLVPPDQVLLTSHRAGKNTSPRLMSSQISSSPLISISCINCIFQGKETLRRPWRRIILGTRTAGCIKAYFVKIRLKLSKAPFIKLLTICQDCCTELDLDQSAHIDRIPNFKGVPNCGKLVFRVSYKEMEEIFTSRVIVLVGMFTTPFLTIDRDGPPGQWKEWNICNQ